MNKGSMLDAIKRHLNMKKNTEFASFLGISSQAVSNWYARNSFDAELIYTKCDFLNPDWLLTGREPMLRENEEKKSIAISRIENIISIPLVDISVAAGINGYDNPDYIETVDHLKLPDTMLKIDATYLCIRVKGESMSPTLLDSTYVIIRLLNCSEWEEMPDQHICVVSDKEGRAYIKRLKNRISQHGFIVCTSDNPDKYCYPNFNLKVDEINTIWHAEWYFSAKMPNIHETYYNKVSELQDDVDLIKDQMRKIMKSIVK